MSKTHSDFVSTLQHRARQQAKLHTVQFLPGFLKPVMGIIAEYPWQSLLTISFLTAGVIFLTWFEFFFTFVHNRL